MSLPEIIEKIKSGDAVFPDMIKITFPEGFNLEQIATRVSEHTINQKKTLCALQLIRNILMN